MGTNDWETEIYGKGRQVNRWPFSDVVSDVMRLTAGADRSELSVLDLGCGTGNNVWFFLDSGFEVSGIDIAPSAIGIALDRLRSLGLPEADLRVGDIVQLPWPDGRFDLVVDRGTMSQITLDDAERALAEVRRVLKPGGIFLSYNLFGWNNSGRSYGHEVAPRSFSEFSGGRFESKSPMTTFFDKSLIYELWSPLRVTQLLRHEVTTDGSDTVEEYFTVHGLKSP